MSDPENASVRSIIARSPATERGGYYEVSYTGEMDDAESSRVRFDVAHYVHRMFADERPCDALDRIVDELEDAVFIEGEYGE